MQKTSDIIIFDDTNFCYLTIFYHMINFVQKETRDKLVTNQSYLHSIASKVNIKDFIIL